MHTKVAPIAYKALGAGAPLLLIHGGFSDGPLTWGVQMTACADKHRLIVVDRRGHGKSPRQPCPYTIAGDAADCLTALNDTDVQSAHIAGHSYGGLVALELAMQAPERVLSLHMIEPPYLTLLPNDADVQSLSVLGSTIFAQAEHLSPDEIATMFFTAILGNEAVARLRAKPVWQALIREAKAEAYSQFPTSYPAQRASELCLDVPVRVYCGEKSNPGMQKIAGVVADAIYGAQLTKIADAGHDLQRSADFNTALLNVTYDGESRKTVPHPPEAPML